jgi:hypothetical protein
VEPTVNTASPLLKILGDFVLRLFIRREVEPKEEWSAQLGNQCQILVRVNSKVAKILSVHPETISKVMLSTEGKSAFAHGESVTIITKQNSNVHTEPLYWIYWQTNFFSRYKSKIRVMYPPQVF